MVTVMTHIYDTGGYSQTSKHVRGTMAKYKVANSSSIEHIPGEIEEKWETKRSMKTFTPMSKANITIFT